MREERGKGKWLAREELEVKIGKRCVEVNRRVVQRLGVGRR